MHESYLFPVGCSNPAQLSSAQAQAQLDSVQQLLKIISSRCAAVKGRSQANGEKQLKASVRQALYGSASVCVEHEYMRCRLPAGSKVIA